LIAVASILELAQIKLAVALKVV